MQDSILYTISYNNREALPKEATDTCRFFSGLLHDADKLNVRVVTGYYNQNSFIRNSAVKLSPQNTRGFAEKVYRVSKGNALISVYLEHVETEKHKQEIGKAGFYLQNRFSGNIIHEFEPELSRILNRKIYAIQKH